MKAVDPKFNPDTGVLTVSFTPDKDTTDFALNGAAYGLLKDYDNATAARLVMAVAVALGYQLPKVG